MPQHGRWVLAATILGSSLTFIDATVVNVALPALQADLHATMTDVQWVIEAYALFLGALILVGGSLADQFGRKRVFLSGVALFTAASRVVINAFRLGRFASSSADWARLISRCFWKLRNTSMELPSSSAICA